MNRYLKNLNKIEFVITYACSGRCKHCSEGAHTPCGEHIDPDLASRAVEKICVEYNVDTVMAFGGEPLLYPEAVFAVMNAARNAKVSKRQVITNGLFSKDSKYVAEVAEMLRECSVNDLLLSVDAFHQETIPLDAVKQFAEDVKKCGVPIRLQPAWLVSTEDDNPYNKRTREILDSFGDMSIPIGEGNVIFPEGNAVKYLSEYFKDHVPANPYVEDPLNVRCLSVSPNGDLLDGNLYNRDVMTIIDKYSPEMPTEKLKIRV